MRQTTPARGLFAVWFATLTFAAALQGVVPLFPLYRQEFGLTSGDLTLVFAVYAIVLVPALLLLGPLSDSVGRKVVLLPSLALTLLASLWLAEVGDVGGLVIGRVLQGIAAGAFWGTSAAFARDLTPDDRRDDASLLISATFSGGIAAGSAMFGAIAAVTGSSAVPWLVHAGLLAIALTLLLPLTETVPVRLSPSFRLRLQLPSGHERGFILFVAPLITAFSSLTGIYLALSPSLLSEVGAGGSAQSGLLVGFMLILATAVQVLTRTSVKAELGSVLGCGVIIIGSAVVGLALTAQSAWLLVASLAIVGVGNGLAIRGTLSLAERMSDPTNRAVAVTAFTVVLYATTSLPTLTAGYIADHLGLTATVVTMTVFAAGALAFAIVLGRSHLRAHVLAAGAGS